MELIVPRVADFAVTGAGQAPEWQGVAWQPLSRVGDGQATYPTRAKVAYSATGLYFLVECADRRLTCTMMQDNDDIFREDVVEVFLWPYEPQHVYFEYEISPLDVELSILVANHQGIFHGWLPWHYEGSRRVRHATTVQGGPQAAMAAVSGWTTEFFFPFSLFAGLGNTPLPPARAGAGISTALITTSNPPASGRGARTPAATSTISNISGRLFLRNKAHEGKI